jgi:hypothetical protein
VCQGLCDSSHRSICNIMRNILLFNSDDRPFEVAAIERLFQSELGFRDVRFDEPGGAVIQADYVEPEYQTIVRLNKDRSTISLSGMSDTALRVALILQRNLSTPLRMVDTDYSFDIIVKDFPTFDALCSAIERKQTS